MTKEFCDFCGEVIEDYNRGIGGEHGLAFELTGRGSAIRGILLKEGDGSDWKGISACRHCIIDAVNRLDRRPKAKTTQT